MGFELGSPMLTTRVSTHWLRGHPQGWRATLEFKCLRQGYIITDSKLPLLHLSMVTFQTTSYSQSSLTYLQQVDDPDHLSTAASDRLKEPGAGHHLSADSIHTGAWERLLKHRLHGQHPQIILEDDITTKFSSKFCWAVVGQ